MKIDHSVISRSLKRIAENYQVVEKKAGKWTLTQMGQRVNDISRATIAAQQAALNSQASLRIRTNREFGARIVAENFISFQTIFPSTLITLKTFERGTEKALLQGRGLTKMQNGTVTIVADRVTESTRPV